MSDTVSDRAEYFLTHILPYILIVLTIVLIVIGCYHYRKGTCRNKEDKIQTNEFSNRLLYENL